MNYIIKMDANEYIIGTNGDDYETQLKSYARLEETYSMINAGNGTVTISEELVVCPGFSFEQFQKTKFYKNQDVIRMIYLDEELIIENRKYRVSLFFRDGKLYMLSLMCCDKWFSEIDERKREELHDNILKEWGMKKYEKYCWGEVSSEYDYRSNISSINIIYL